MSRIHNREYRLESKKHRVSKQSYTTTGGTHQHTIPVILKLLMWAHVFKVRLFWLCFIHVFFYPKLNFQFYFQLLFRHRNRAHSPRRKTFIFVEYFHVLQSK